MADVDHLDALSNTELSKQLKAQGLPNIAVTDSTRKVLVKRLRASLGGNATLPASSPKKASSNRRETLQPAAASVVSVDKRDGGTSSKDGANGATSSKARRTIAATPSDTKEAADRRRKPETVAPPLPRVPEATTAKQVATTTVPAPKAAAPIQTRRISNAAKPETIAEKTTTVSNQRSPENVLEVNSLIILESDEEEDEQLARAAQNAEDQYKHTQKAATSKLTTTTTNTHQYVSKPVYRAPESVQEPPQRRTHLYEGPSASQARNTLGGYDISSFNRTGRYSSYVGSTAPIYPTTSSSTYRRSPPRTFANEFSDDTAEEEDPGQAQGGVKFESDFARKLAMLRSERIGDRSSSYNRHSAGRTGSTYEPVARRSLRPDNVPVSVAFSRWIQSLDRTYSLKSKLFILFVLVIIYVVYKLYY